MCSSSHPWENSLRLKCNGMESWPLNNSQYIYILNWLENRQSWTFLLDLLQMNKIAIWAKLSLKIDSDWYINEQLYYSPIWAGTAVVCNSPPNLVTINLLSIGMIKKNVFTLKSASNSSFLFKNEKKNSKKKKQQQIDKCRKI